MMSFGGFGATWIFFLTSFRTRYSLDGFHCRESCSPRFNIFQPIRFLRFPGHLVPGVTPVIMSAGSGRDACLVVLHEYSIGDFWMPHFAEIGASLNFLAPAVDLSVLILPIVIGTTVKIH